LKNEREVTREGNTGMERQIQIKKESKEKYSHDWGRKKGECDGFQETLDLYLSDIEGLNSNISDLEVRKLEMRKEMEQNDTE
jgi:archaellum component FlaC